MDPYIFRALQIWNIQGYNSSKRQLVHIYWASEEKKSKKGKFRKTLHQKKSDIRAFATGAKNITDSSENIQSLMEY